MSGAKTVSALLMREAQRLIVLRPHRHHPLWNRLEVRWYVGVSPRWQGLLSTSIRDSIYPEGAEQWFRA